MDNSRAQVLPRQLAQSQDRLLLHQPSEIEGKRNRQYRVLIVDDDDDNLLFAQYAVEGFGYKALPIPTGHGAVNAALTYQPDVILLDILLDGINGVDIMRQLKIHEQTAQVPVIAVTALVQSCDREKFMKAGFADYLPKPYMLDELQVVMSAHLPNRVLQKRVERPLPIFPGYDT